MMLESKIPEMMAPPKPRHKGSARVMGSSPSTVQSLVKMIGSKRLASASAIEEIRFMPSLISKSDKTPILVNTLIVNMLK